MTAEEANRCYRIPPKVLRAYERWGFCRQKDGAAQYGEEDLAALSLLVTLCGAGFCLADAGEYLRLERAGEETRTARLRLLDGKRAQALKALHLQEERLTALDALRHELTAAGRRKEKP